MPDDALTLFQAEAELRKALARERALTDAAEAGALLVAAGHNGLRALDAVARDDEFWDRLAVDAPAPVGEEQLQLMWEILDGGWSTLLEGLGYEPPPPAAELADTLLGGLARLVARPPTAAEATRTLAELRSNLMDFADELRTLLLAAPALPEALRARSLRAPLQTFVEVLGVSAPLAIGTLLPPFGPVVAMAVSGGLQSLIVGRRKRTLAEARVWARKVMSTLAQVLDGTDVDAREHSRMIVEAAWRADAALRPVAVLDEDDASVREALRLLRDIRGRGAAGLEIGPERKEGVRDWMTLPQGWFDGVLRRDEERCREERGE